VIFEKNEILKDNAQPYCLPYSRRWKDKLTDFFLSSHSTEKYFINFSNRALKPIILWKAWGFKRELILSLHGS